jgi:starch synthase (maltosyl-transferring)
MKRWFQTTLTPFDPRLSLASEDRGLAPYLRTPVAYPRPIPDLPSHVPPKTARRSTNRAHEHLLIECVTPELDAGRYPVKRVVGDTVVVGADIIKDGHDLVAAHALVRGPGDAEWRTVPLRSDFDHDRWYGSFDVDRIGRWTFTVEAWTDFFGTWRTGFRKKVDAGVDVQVELLEGAEFARTASRRAKGDDRTALIEAARVLGTRDGGERTDARIRRALSDDFSELVERWLPPRDLTRYSRELMIVVDRERARFGAWYELFPRSQNPQGHHGTFDDTAKRLPRLAELGWDVVYLPPIHPIGRTFRKGKNNSLAPEPNDVGSPWAIGSEEGGHTAIHPQLGTVEDFERFVAEASRHGLEIALDYALQCSPDHPWVKEHPDWFHIRPDGSIQYAENPPKKYQDIYPINFWCDDRENLWRACRDALFYWIERGVKIFRVDNPHTKPFAFWEWAIDEVQRQYPDVIFFAEAFTRPKRMKALAKVGFTMSYTYFTWKNTGWELREYLEELTDSPMVEYYRGNFFANTPDILNEYLVHGGRAAFRIRLLLAATLLPNYGIYSGFELYENIPVKPGSEEYLDSEKYQIKPRDWDAPGSLNPEIQLINRLRREHRALQLYANLTFHESENPDILVYRKAAEEPVLQWGTGERGAHRVPSAMLRPAGEAPGTNGAPAESPVRAGAISNADLFIIVNLDPHAVNETMVHLPIGDLGISEDDPYQVHDLLTGARYTWRGERNYVRLEPPAQVGHVLRIER